MTAHILITGGTGTLGRQVVSQLRDAGREVRVLSRHIGPAGPGSLEMVAGNLDTGAGIDAAVQDIETVIHCAGSRTGDEVRTATLLQAASRSGVRHLVYISVVGADRVRSTAPSTAPCSATSHRSSRQSSSSPSPACPGRRCAPRSSRTRSSRWRVRIDPAAGRPGGGRLPLPARRRRRGGGPAGRCPCPAGRARPRPRRPADVRDADLLAPTSAPWAASGPSCRCPCRAGPREPCATAPSSRPGSGRRSADVGGGPSPARRPRTTPAAPSRCGRRDD